jgi:FdhD protein
LNRVSLKEFKVFGVRDSELSVQCRHSITYKNNHLYAAEYALAVEEPLEIFIDGRLYGTTMRSPGDDINLAVGLCYTEGIIDDWGNIKSLKDAQTVDGQSQVLVEVQRQGWQQTTRIFKEVPISGRSEPVDSEGAPRDFICKTKECATGFTPILLRDVFASSQALETKQGLFSLTGCTHACAIFNREGMMLSLGEDVGRQNALDKAVGFLVRPGRQRESYMVLISSRLSAEIVRKAARLGIEILAGMSGPTEKAVATALSLNLTLIGFLRGDSLTIYTHPQRVIIL